MTEEAAAVETRPAEYAEYLKEKNFNIESLGFNNSGIEMIKLGASDLLAVVKELKRTKKMNILNFVTALEVKDGYQAVYQLENHDQPWHDKSAVVLKVTVARDNPSIPSLTSVYPTADWQEREAFDMIGIVFSEHPNLTRILNPDAWQGHPLRKDYIGPADELNQPVKFPGK